MRLILCALALTLGACSGVRSPVRVCVSNPADLFANPAEAPASMLPAEEPVCEPVYRQPDCGRWEPLENLLKPVSSTACGVTLATRALLGVDVNPDPATDPVWPTAQPR